MKRGKVMRREGTDDHEAVRLRQPYEVEVEGISLVVCKEVFPPDVGTISRHICRQLTQYRAESALDMGTGSGFLALAMRGHGFRDVWAVDIDPQAVACTRMNLDRNPQLKPIEVRQSDLFSNVPPDQKFDVITFNQPFFAAVDDYYLAPSLDGGRPIIFRFLDQARAHLNEHGVLIMSHQTTSGPENDPAAIAEELGLTVKVLVREDVAKISKFVYEIQYR
jgi:release factor glutamine methyltransferase